jgi:transcriptional regulator with XRE-family HTH domain
MNRAKDTFRFPARLGARLRELRKRAGLTQRELAGLMGRSAATARPRITLLEQGRITFPTLAFIADYLRACRASFDDLADILSQYTIKPPAPDREGLRRVRKFTRNLPAPVATVVERYDVKTAVARRFSGKQPLEPDQRELRARRLAASWFQRDRLDSWLNEAVNDIGILPVLGVRYLVFNFAHRVWRILKQTRPRPGVIRRPDPRRQTRDQRLDEAERNAIEQAEGMVPGSGFRYIRDTVVALFELMEKDGVLDWLPTAQQARHIPRPIPQRKPRAPTTGGLAGLDPKSERRAKLSVYLRNLVNTRMEQEGFERDQRLRYCNWLIQVALVAQQTEDNPPERARRTEELVEAARNPDQTRCVAQWFYEVYEQWRPKWKQR